MDKNTFLTRVNVFLENTHQSPSCFCLDPSNPKSFVTVINVNYLEGEINFTAVDYNKAKNEGLYCEIDLPSIISKAHEELMSLHNKKHAKKPPLSTLPNELIEEKAHDLTVQAATTWLHNNAYEQYSDMFV